MIHTQANGETHRGKIRSRNEDSLVTDPSLRLYAVADGMGGHVGGDVASKLAIDVLQRELEKSLELASTLSPAMLEIGHCITLERAVRMANEAICQQNLASGLERGSGMGTTLTGFWCIGETGKAVLFNVGDSRVYRFRAGRLHQLTTDHSAWQEWHNRGRVGTEPRRNVITRSLGLEEQGFVVDLSVQRLQDDDTLLACSDGLTEMVPDAELQRMLIEHMAEPASELCQRFIHAALENGGADNITVIVGKVA